MGLLKSKAPNLPVATTAYSQDQQLQRDNALRLYFNEIDGGYWDGSKIQNAYASISDNTDQYASGNNTPAQITFDTTDYINWMEHVSNDGLKVVYPGIYNCQFSIQFANTDTQIHEATVWLKKKANGAVSSSNIAGTGSKFSIPNRHGGVDGYLIAALNFYVQLDALDSLELWWEGSVVGNSTGTIKGIYIEHYAAAGNIPAIPSAVITLSYVSAVPT